MTLSRCTKDFEIKTDTVAVMKVEGSQTGETIRSDVKRELVLMGWEEDWLLGWVTDNEAKQKSAREVGRHNNVGLRTCHTASCVDHTAHLAVEEALEGRGVIDVKETMDRVRRLINKMKDSHKLKEEFVAVMIAANEKPLALIQGTSNRWYFILMEAMRVLELREHVEKFQEDSLNLPADLVLSRSDWHNLSIYVRTVKSMSDASTLLEGEKYPTASSVIPYLDQVFYDLGDLAGRLTPADQAFPKALLTQLKSPNRFPGGYKSLCPFNCLTLLDPRYMDNGHLLF